MKLPVSVRAYGSLMWLYPRRFRNEYRDDMVLLFAEQLRDESSLRVWARSVIDLAVAVPTNHLEARMHRSAHSLVPALLAGASFTALSAGLVVGSIVPRVVLIGLFAFALASGSLAMTAFRRSRPITGKKPASAHWWKFVGGGAVALGAFIVVTSATGQIADAWWLPAMGALLCAIAILGTGVVLGCVRLTERHPRSTAS